MTKAVVIKTYGDPEIAGAIMDGLTKRVIPLNEDELASVKAELAKLKGRSEIRAYGDEKRFEAACEDLARKYSTRPTGRLAGALMGLYGLACLWVATTYERLAAWNRG